jgi:hypothetical protein
MPSITIKDNLNADVISANPLVSTGLGKYFKGQSAALLAGVDVAGQLRTPLALANVGESGLGFKWADDISLGGKSNVALTVEGGAKAVVGVLNRAGMQVFGTTFIGEVMKVPAGQALVSFTFRPALALGLKNTVGALSFGFAAGAEADITYFHPFDITGPAAPPFKVADAAKTVLEQFVVPNSADDLRRMKDLPENAIAAVSGHGELRVGVSVDVAAAFNPLASVGSIPKLGSITASSAVSASVGVKAKVSGDFQIRVQKMKGAVIRLSYHKIAGREVEVSLTGSAGLGISLGDRDLLKLLFDGPGGLPGKSREDLVQGGITSAQLKRVSDAMKAGLSRKIELSLAASFSSISTNEAAFLYEIDLAALDAAGASAIDSALSGDLTALNALDQAGQGSGIKVLRSRTQAVSKKKVSWRLNLIGIVNVLSMKELVKSGTVAVDEESGEVVIVDKITSDRVGATSVRKHIRRLLYESTIMSLTYRAVGLDPTVKTALDINQSFFFFDKSANRQRVSDYLDAVRAVGLIGNDGDAQLGGEDDFGKASLLIETSFSGPTSVKVFETPTGQGTPSADDYENIGRAALLSLIKKGEADDYRRLPLEQIGLWKKMREAGQANIRHVLPPPIRGGSDEAIRVGVIVSDYTLIVWWASAMATAAEQLAKMRAFLAAKGATGADPVTLDNDAEFQKQREKLSEAMVKAIKKNESAFDDPWGLVALHHASRGAAKAEATLISSKLTLFLPA